MQKKPGSPLIRRSLYLGIVLAGGLASCHKRSSAPGPSAEQDPSGLIIPTQPLPPMDSTDGTIKWPNGQVSFAMKIKDRSYIQVNGLVAPNTYAEFLRQGSPVADADVKRDLLDGLNQTLSQLEAQVSEEFILKQVVPEAGYYSMWIPYSENLWSRLQNVKQLPLSLTLEAVSSDPQEMQRIKQQSERINSQIVAANAKETNDGFSGLVRIGVTNEWLAELEAQLGEKVDGSLVKVGITDTGITYNHPSFQDVGGNNRISYMKDFTQEGKVYFPNTAKFSVRAGTAEEAARAGTTVDKLLMAELVSAHVNTIAGTPPADGPNLIALPRGTPLIVPPEVKQAAESGAVVRLGFLAEAAFGTTFDLNYNSKVDDLLGLILVSPAGSSNAANAKVYVGLNAIGTLTPAGALTISRIDLSKATALRDYNSTRDITQSYAEKFGLAFESLKLKSAVDGRDVDTVAVGIVGYDSGVHGSHVAGIIGGRKTILNDSDLTLARGVAPNAQLYSDRVCSNTRGCSASNAIIDLALSAKVDVINMSLGGLSNLNDGYDTQSLLIDRLTQISNAQFIISAGNSGPGLQTVGSPSTARLSISVAASASADMMGRQSQILVPTAEPAVDDDFVMTFSSRGPLGNGGFKPSVTAPGTQLSASSFHKSGRSGMEIMQGTSMAAPTVTGAYALLLDAARRYNRKHPEAPLPTDNLTLRKVLIGSAKPFDVRTFDPKTGRNTQGQYTWIDEGMGIVNVPSAWSALKALALVTVPSGIKVAGKDIQPVYEVRTLMTNRYGKVYDGKPAADGSGVRPYGAGLWIDARSLRTLYSVGIARRLPLLADGMLTRDQQGDAFNQLKASGEVFTLKTEIHGSDIEWLKVNGVAAANTGEGNRCDETEAGSRLTLNSEGALDADSIGGVPESVVYVCVDREKLARLPKGDHGALIRAYRQSADGSIKENVPAFIIPVYLSLPHETLTAGKAYTVSQAQVKSMGVSRNYVEVPADVSTLRVTLSVNKATLDAFGQAQNCSGVWLNLQAADNTVGPDIFERPIAYNCTGPGYSIGANEDALSKFVGEVLSPKAGIWDMHVEGLSRYPKSTYQLRVDYVKASSQQKEIKGNLDALNGSLNIEIKEGSLANNVSAARSSYILNEATQTVNPEIKTEQSLEVASRGGIVLRTYSDKVTRVSVATFGAAGSDLDLSILECTAAGTGCQSVQASAGPTDEEAATFTPRAGFAYKFVVDGFDVLNGTAKFQLSESIAFETGATGRLTASQLGSDRFWNVAYALDRNDPFFKSEIFVKDPFYDVRGTIRVSSSDLTLAVVPVQIRLN